MQLTNFKIFHMSKRNPYKVFIPIFMILFLISPLFSSPRTPFSGPPPLVKVIKVKVKDVNPPAEYIGHVEAIDEVNIIARVNGFLEQVNFKEGEYIHKGKLLYVIEEAPYKAALDAAKARVIEAKATLQKISKKLKRLKAVHKGGVPITEIEDAEADKLKALGLLKEAEANLETAKINWGYTKIYAPISGQIGKTFYTEGNLVGPTTGPLAKIVRLNPIRVVYAVSENDILNIKKSLNNPKGRNSLLETSIKLPNGKLYKYQGHIEFVENQIDPTTATIEVRSIFKNPEHILIPGMFVKVLLKRSKPKLMPIVPQSAVQLDKKGYFVLLVDEKNSVVKRRIKVGKTIGTDWIVEKGLSGGETLIVEGIQKVFPGIKVKVIPQNENN